MRPHTVFFVAWLETRSVQGWPTSVCGQLNNNPWRTPPSFFFACPTAQDMRPQAPSRKPKCVPYILLPLKTTRKPFIAPWVLYGSVHGSHIFETVIHGSEKKTQGRTITQLDKYEYRGSPLVFFFFYRIRS